MKPESALLAELLPFVVQSAHFWDYAINSAAGSVNKFTSWTKIRDYQFLLPPRDQQVRLAELLWAADDVEKTKVRLREQLHETRKSYHQTYFDAYDTISIGEIASKVGSGKTPTGGEKVYSKDGATFLRSQNVLVGKIDFTDIAYIPDEVHKSMKSSKVLDGDVLLNISGASIGRSAVFEGQVKEANVNQHVCIIRSANYASWVLCEYLNSAYGQDQINKLQTGGNRQGLNFQNLKELEIPNFRDKMMPKVLKDINRIRVQDFQLEEAVASAAALKQQLINQIFFK